MLLCVSAKFVNALRWAAKFVKEDDRALKNTVRIIKNYGVSDHDIEIILNQAKQDNYVYIK